MNKSRHVYTLFSLMLFLLFVIGSFFIVTYEIKGYQNIHEGELRQDHLTTPLAYLNTKLKAYDRKDMIEINTIHDIECLCLKTEKTVTYIYYLDGYLYENYTTLDYLPSLHEGTKLFSLDSFSIQMKDNLYHFILEKDGQEKALSLYIHS